MWLAPAFQKLGLQVVEVAVSDPFDERFPLGAIVGQDWPVGILGVSDEHSVSASSDADAVAGIALPRDAPRKVPKRRRDRRWHFWFSLLSFLGKSAARTASATSGRGGLVRAPDLGDQASGVPWTQCAVPQIFNCLAVPVDLGRAFLIAIGEEALHKDDRPLLQVLPKFQERKIAVRAGMGAGAAALIGRLESASVLLARRRWQRLAGEQEAAVRQARADAEAASIAATAWLGLVRTYLTTAGCDDDESLVRYTLQFAAALPEPFWPHLP